MKRSLFLLGLRLEQVFRQWLFIPRRSHEHIVGTAALGQNLGQRRGVPTTVGIQPYLGLYAKFLAEKALAVQRLPHKGLAAWHVAVWLDPPAAYDL